MPESLKDWLQCASVVAVGVTVGNSLTPPEFLRVAVWHWIIWLMLG